MIRRMNASLRAGTLGLGLLLLASTAAVSQAPSGASDDSNMEVMSDTPEWCVHLQGEVAALRQAVTKPHAEADMLAREGRRLCSLGRIRLGIMRLRYALMHLQEIQNGQQVQTGP